MTECPVGLPNGKKKSASRCAHVYLTLGIVLTNVLYVPQLNCNLISVTHLIDDVNCVVQFTKIFCIMQDPSLRALIGASERRDGIYYFRVVPKIQAFTVVGLISPKMWHKRLGHPSNKEVKSLPVVCSTNSAMNKACDVCHQAK